MTDPTPRRAGSEGPDYLFVYGTLLPGQRRWRFLAPCVEPSDLAGTADSAPGDLYDSGVGYPAAIFADDERYRGGITHGRRFRLQPGALAESLARLDEVEGAVAGLFRRVIVLTDSGVTAWSYAYGSGLTLTPITTGDWLGRKPEHT